MKIESQKDVTIKDSAISLMVYGVVLLEELVNYIKTITPRT